MARHHEARSPSAPRAPFIALAVALLVGCALVPVDSILNTPGLPRFSSSHTPYATRDVIFSHETHSFASCDTCHLDARGGDPDLAAARADLPAMAICFQCHDGTSLSNDCELCHVENRALRKPQFHNATWPRAHEHMADSEAYKCQLCHIENDCADCHSERMPLSHTPRFNRSTHGRMATRDRESCATCHLSEFCEDCHSQPPPDHTPAFIGDLTLGVAGHKQAALLRGRACLVCHGFEDACASCHP